MLFRLWNLNELQEGRSDWIVSLIVGGELRDAGNSSERAWVVQPTADNYQTSGNDNCYGGEYFLRQLANNSPSGENLTE